MNIVLGLCKTLLQIITYIKVPGKKKTILRQKKTLEEIKTEINHKIDYILLIRSYISLGIFPLELNNEMKVHFFFLNK